MGGEVIDSVLITVMISCRVPAEALTVEDWKALIRTHVHYREILHAKATDLFPWERLQTLALKRANRVITLEDLL